MTHFLQQHPGGEEVLLDVLGTNATESFEDVGHSEESRELLSRYLLGSLHEDDCEAWVEKNRITNNNDENAKTDGKDENAKTDQKDENAKTDGKETIIID